MSLNDSLYDRFEALTPSGRSDVPVDQLIELLRKAPEATKETPCALRILVDFKQATRLNPPLPGDLSLWLGYCVAGFHESPRRDDCFLFALKRDGDSFLGYATGLEPEKDTKPLKTLSADDVERLTDEQMRGIREMLVLLPKNKKRTDTFTTSLLTDGPSFAFEPGLSARFFIRQAGGRLLFVQPSRLGGWYGELWARVA